MVLPFQSLLECQLTADFVALCVVVDFVALCVVVTAVRAFESMQNSATFKSDLASNEMLVFSVWTRKQFPSAPATNPVLPSWQLSKSPQEGSGDVSGVTAVSSAPNVRFATAETQSVELEMPVGLESSQVIATDPVTTATQPEASSITVATSDAPQPITTAAPNGPELVTMATGDVQELDAMAADDAPEPDAMATGDAPEPVTKTMHDVPEPVTTVAADTPELAKASESITAVSEAVAVTSDSVEQQPF